MNYIRRTKTNIKENYLYELLKDRGLVRNQNDYLNYLHPKRTDLLNPLLLRNIDEGFKCLMKHLENHSSILLYVDCDVDGFTSASIIYQYIMDLKNQFDLSFKIDYSVPYDKSHGIERLMPEIGGSKRYDLIIEPDAGSNDIKYNQQLYNLGYEMLILDHHIINETDNPAIVINCQDDTYPNKALCGAGVVYKFISYCDSKLNTEFADKYLDLVALGEIADVMDLTTQENRFLVDYGLSHTENSLFMSMLQKQSFSIKDPFNPTPEEVAFYIGPLINATIRVGTDREKELLFQSFIDGDREVQSTKKGSLLGETEKLSEQATRNAVNAKSKQNREKERAEQELDIQISNDMLDQNKILILNGDELDVEKTMTGLVAMNECSKYSLPTMLGKTTPDGKYLKGSIRNNGDSEFKDFKCFLESSGLVESVVGHSNAARL